MRELCWFAVMGIQLVFSGCNMTVARLDGFPLKAQEKAFYQACNREPRVAFEQLARLLEQPVLRPNFLISWRLAELARQGGWQVEAERLFKVLSPAQQYGARARMASDPAVRLKLVQKAVAADPKFYPGWYLQGRTLLEREDVDGAEAALARAHGLCPVWGPAIFDLGQARLLQKRYGEAARLFTLYLEKRPGDRTAVMALLQVLIRMEGREGEARQLVAGLQKKQPDDREASFFSAVLHELGGRHKQAERIYKKLVGDGVCGSAAAFNLGWLRLKKLQDKKGALQAFKTFLRLSLAADFAGFAERLQAQLYILHLHELGVTE